MRTNVIPVDGMVISEDTQLAPGIYVLPQGIRLAADHITLEGEGVMLISPEAKGVAVHAQGHSGISLRGLSVSGYYHGIRLDDCADVLIEAVTVRNTAKIDGIDTFLYLWRALEEAYSGAILLNNVSGGAVRKCDVQHQLNGIQLYGCTGLIVEGNNASYNGGWGVYLSAANENVIRDNQLDFCNRVYRRPEDGSIRVEADAAGIVLVQGSSRNQFLRNSCLCSGDGIFIAGYRHPGDINPCNDNLFEDNDCRLSPNNAIEATFSRGNIFRRNDCSRSNYGFWMGFSWENTLEDNIIEFNRFAGIAAEHARDIVIRNNRIRINGDGVRLWTRGGAVVPYWQGYEVSYNFTLEDNLIEQNMVGFAGYTGDETTEQVCHHFTLRGNTFHDNRVGALFKRAADCELEGNTFTRNVEAALRLVDKPGVKIGENTFAANTRDVVEE